MRHREAAKIIAVGTQVATGSSTGISKTRKENIRRLLVKAVALTGLRKETKNDNANKIRTETEAGSTRMRSTRTRLAQTASTSTTRRYLLR